MHFKPKKSLGQNFLIDKNIQRKIIVACELKPCDIVLEIGGGRGELSRLIADNVDKVYCLEIDKYLCKILKNGLTGYTNIKIINQDILKFNFKKHFKNSKNKIKVIGNIPFYITTPIIEHLLKYREKINIIFITVQKEFARRITSVAGPKDYGSFSCFAQYYTKAKILFLIKKGCFRPQPNVDSSLVRLEIRKVPPVKINDERLFFKIIRAAFNKRRKTLRNSLKGIVSTERLEVFFNKYNIDTNIRPERLCLEDFAKLTNL